MISERTQDIVPPQEAIWVLTTGGTIDKQYFDALSRYQITDTVITKILNVARVTHLYAIEEVLRKDSIDMTDADRGQIADRIRASAYRRIVITHGTDTMTVTAEALAGIADRTIVLTGALQPARFAESDAAFNLGMAFAAAQLAPAGIYIAMNGSVSLAERVIKDANVGAFVLKSQESL
jgi:L-asparaginase